MSLHISISPEAEALLRTRAEASGMAPDRYAAKIVEDTLHAPRSWREAMGPLQEALRHADVSEEEVTRLLTHAREQTWNSRGEKKAS